MSPKFSKSDSLFELLSAQSQFLAQSADILGQVLTADNESRASLNEELHKVEQNADDACHLVLNKINQSFVLPFDREDLYSLVSVVDDCIDLTDEAGDNFILYKPAALPEGVATQIEILQSCAELSIQTIGRLDRINDSIRESWIEVNKLENQGDKLYRSMIADLFEGGTDALEVLKVKAVLDTLEDAIDAYEHLFGTIEAIAIKES
ncbi:MAG: DUF47 family protein [Actinomycetaceae bacterium]|nr:DUF47 family protein [Actinomycetaceae bacterium]